MWDDFFQLRERNTSTSREMLSGLTTFMTMSYILFVNPAIVSESGMPLTGIFVATALSAALCSLLMGLFANVPLGMAPGMGLNTFFTYVVCGSLNFQWQESLAIVFLVGVLHTLVTCTRLRREIVNAIPHSLRFSYAVGLGLFIAYIGLQYADAVMFTTPPGQYEILAGGAVVSNSTVIPDVVSRLNGQHFVALVGLGVMLFFLALEKKTGESYAALPVGMLVAAFIGIPLNVTHLVGAELFSLSALSAAKDVLFAFWGDPGLLSVLGDPHKALLACLVIMIQLLTNVMDGVGTIFSIGHVENTEVFSKAEMESFFSKAGNRTRVDKALLCNSFGSGISALCGTVASTTYVESITGIVTGGRTGLTAVTVGVLFLLCLPMSHVFSIIPPAAVAPALVIAGSFMLPMAARIDWKKLEESFPAFATIVCIPIAHNLLYGIISGILAHVLIQIAMGKRREVHPMLYVLSAIFIITVVARNCL